MCYKIDPPFILVQELKKKKACTIKDLVRKKYEIERTIPSVFIDVSKNSILQTIASYPRIFEWDNNKIKKRVSPKPEIIEYFSKDVDNKIKKQIIGFFNE